MTEYTVAYGPFGSPDWVRKRSLLPDSRRLPWSSDDTARCLDHYRSGTCDDRHVLDHRIRATVTQDAQATAALGGGGYPLFSTTNVEWQNAVKVHVNSEQINNPFVVNLRISNVGDRDIDSGSFDAGRPIIFDVSTKRATLLTSRDTPPGLRVSGTRVHVAPELLRRGRCWTISLLTSGRPETRLVEEHLIDTTIREDSTKPPSRTLVLSRPVILAGAAAIMLWTLSTVLVVALFA